MALHLTPQTSPGSSVLSEQDGTARLEIPAGSAKRYRIAQLDDYRRLPRNQYPWRPPITLRLEARISDENLAGTWGFGLWNAPFNLTLGFGGNAWLPALPNAAWFFYASERNYLSLRNETPASGFMGQVFRSAPVPIPALIPAIPLLPFLAIRPAARLLRAAAAKWLVFDDARAAETGHLTRWQRYEIDWQTDSIAFRIDGSLLFESAVAPRPPLGLVLWIDNQFAAFTPEGRIGYGLEPHPKPAWLEVRSIKVETRVAAAIS